MIPGAVRNLEHGILNGMILQSHTSNLRILLSAPLFLCVSVLFVSAPLAQQPQNPSPMVEHTRAHPRIEKQSPPGRREALSLGTLFVPEKLKLKDGAPLLFFFHGGDWLPEVAAARHGKMAVVRVQLGAGSARYAQPFADRERFAQLLAEAESKAGVKFGRITLAGWSAGCAAVREILKSPAAYERVSGALLIDGIHAGYVGGKPGPQESQIETDNLQIFVQLARDAIAGRKQMIVTHSEIFPGTYASTTETADWLLREIGVPRRAVLKWGPMQTQQLGEARRGKFLLIGYAGNSAPDHVDQLHSLPDYLRWLK